jgi:hypothetical protein
MINDHVFVSSEMGYKPEFRFEFKTVKVLINENQKGSAWPARVEGHDPDRI